jgi:hypothetical protein
MRRTDPVSIIGGVELTPSIWGLFEGEIFAVALQSPFDEACECKLNFDGKEILSRQILPVWRGVIEGPVQGERFKYVPVFDEEKQKPRPSMVVEASFDTGEARRPDDRTVSIQLWGLGPVPSGKLQQPWLDALARRAELAVLSEYYSTIHWEDIEFSAVVYHHIWRGLWPEAIAEAAGMDLDAVNFFLESFQKDRSGYLEPLIAGSERSIIEYAKEAHAAASV